MSRRAFAEEALKVKIFFMDTDEEVLCLHMAQDKPRHRKALISREKRACM